MNKRFLFAVAASVLCCAGIASADRIDGTQNAREGRGACCFEDGQCSIFTLKQCEIEGGIYQGDGTVCSVERCPGKGACCFTADTCLNITMTLCGILGGTLHLLQV